MWTTILHGWEVLVHGERLLNRYSLSFWDSVILAACLEGGVTRLYSEDFDVRRVDGLEISNPFKST